MTTYSERVLSGMRPTGKLHLGHYHGVLKNWIALQDKYPCLFFVADWHALTTHYETPGGVCQSAMDMLIDWLAAGVDPEKATLFIQSKVPEHAELHLLLSMMTPLGWLERVPTYKDQQEKLAGRDLMTYGFLGYPLLMSADILIYRANRVPVGEDQIPHIEFTRELARRFNHMYGREPDFEEKVKTALKKMGNKAARAFEAFRARFRQEGDASATEAARALLKESQSLAGEEKDRLAAYLTGAGKTILVEPAALLTEASKMPGLDGLKMSKSYGNTISLREDEASIIQKIKRMPTDPSRVRRNDPGDPEKCPVWQLHQVYSNAACREWVKESCRRAGMGCLECKQPVIDGILAEQGPMRERAGVYIDKPERVREIVEEGSAKARKLAGECMEDVRCAMGLSGV